MVPIVFVDDDVLGVDEILTTLLRREGHEVIHFRGGDEALDYAESHAGPVLLFLASLHHFFASRTRIERACSLERVRVVLATGAPLRNVPQVPHLVILAKPFNVGALLAAIAEAA